MKSFIRKLPLITEGLMIALMLFFSYEMYELCHAFHKSIVYFFVPTALTILLCITYRGKKQLAECQEIRKYVLPVCKPYEWIGSVTMRLCNRFPIFRKEYSSARSCLYPLFSFLPILPINLAVTANIYMASWDSVFSAVCFVASTVVIFIIVGLLSYTAIELSFQLAACITHHIRKRL